eukprot:768398-Hanusia_phi.AAC.5
MKNVNSGKSTVISTVNELLDAISKAMDTQHTVNMNSKPKLRNDMIVDQIDLEISRLRQMSCKLPQSLTFPLGSDRLFTILSEATIESLPLLQLVKKGRRYAEDAELQKVPLKLLFCCSLPCCALDIGGRAGTLTKLVLFKPGGGERDLKCETYDPDREFCSDADHDSGSIPVRLTSTDVIHAYATSGSALPEEAATNFKRYGRVEAAVADVWVAVPARDRSQASKRHRSCRRADCALGSQEAFHYRWGLDAERKVTLSSPSGTR